MRKNTTGATGTTSTTSLTMKEWAGRVGAEGERRRTTVFIKEDLLARVRIEALYAHGAPSSLIELAILNLVEELESQRRYGQRGRLRAKRPRAIAPKETTNPGEVGQCA